MRNVVLRFGLLILALLVLFQLSEYSYLSGNLAIEFLIGGFSVLFFALGIFLTRKYLNRTPREPRIEPDFDKIRKMGISDREYEILQMIDQGLSNHEIGEKLFISESTIKTHVSNLLVKLNAKRRTEAVRIAKDNGILV